MLGSVREAGTRWLTAESAAAMVAAHESGLSCAPSCRAVGDDGEYRRDGRVGTGRVGWTPKLCINTATPSRSRAMGGGGGKLDLGG
jgi:hypothetical protein